MSAGQVKTYSIVVPGDDGKQIDVRLENAPQGAATIVLTELATGETWTSEWTTFGFVGERVLSGVTAPGNYTATITAHAAFSTTPLSLEIYG